MQKQTWREKLLSFDKKLSWIKKCFGLCVFLTCVRIQKSGNSSQAIKTTLIGRVRVRAMFYELENPVSLN